MDKESVKKIIEAGVLAPSGGNSQPWRFEVDGSKVYVWALPERDHAILNFRYRGTWIAHGALLENMITAASKTGFLASVKIFPRPEEPNLTFEINFEKIFPNPEPFYEAIFKRCTNRKIYNTTPLSKNQKEDLSRLGGDFLKLIEDPVQIKILAEAVSANEIVMLENKVLHKLFFQEIVWTDKEELQKKTGLYLRTMEIPPPAQVMLRLFKRWPIMKFANKLGAARKIAADNAKNYAAVAAMCVIVVNDSDNNFIEAGRIIERLWLYATAANLKFHLITGVPFLWQGINSGKTSSIFSKEHIDFIKKAYQDIVEVSGSDGKIPVAIFRIGEDGEPSARSSRLPPNIKFKNGI